jgi:hypothetical protein
VVALLSAALAIAILALATRAGRDAAPPADIEAAPPPVPTVAEPDGNWIRNGRFDRGRDPWFHLGGDKPYWHGFEVAPRPGGAAGAYAARLVLAAPPTASAIAIHGCAQDIVPAPGHAELPEVLSGAYRVARWRRALPKQYVQAVLIATSDEFGLPGAHGNHQLRFILTGLTERPFDMPAARFLFLGPAEPQAGDAWVRFERDLRADWKSAWGADWPHRCDEIRVLFEVRFDDGQRLASPAGEELAEVWFDDLYLGPRRK